MFNLIINTTKNLLFGEDFCEPGVRLCGSPAFKSRPANCKIKRRNNHHNGTVLRDIQKHATSYFLKDKLTKPGENQILY